MFAVDVVFRAKEPAVDVVFLSFEALRRFLTVRIFTKIQKKSTRWDEETFAISALPARTFEENTSRDRVVLFERIFQPRRR